ncbi:MAG: metallopeptidase family protein, partial [Actinomycetota bacterium]|nr:metallopeptidase family protein [Actinomycetota bacterium]
DYTRISLEGIDIFRPLNNPTTSINNNIIKPYSFYAGSLPDTISIYRDALLDMCDSEQHVVEEVAITVIHEIAHHFGIDDERLHELGWA